MITLGGQYKSLKSTSRLLDLRSDVISDVGSDVGSGLGSDVGLDVGSLGTPGNIISDLFKPPTV